jgi:hypothetical protein
MNDDGHGFVLFETIGPGFRGIVRDFVGTG